MCATAASDPFEEGLDAYNTGDYVTALRLWRPLAEHGRANAQHNLGVMHRSGQGVPQNYVQAHMWFNLAASRLLPGEGYNAAIQERNLVAESMTPTQIAEAQKLALEWRPRGEQAE
jgi:TPR repeat protein